MKGNKVILIVQTVLMYVAQLPYVVALGFMFFANYDNSGEVVGPAIVAGLIANIAILPVVFISGIMAIIGIFTGSKNPLKLTMIVKIVLIPWYVFNFVLGFCLFAASLNPFLLWSIPITIGLMVVTTYIYMVASNFPMYSYTLNKLIKREWKINALIVWFIILSFIFCLDILGAILLYVSKRSEEGA